MKKRVFYVVNLDRSRIWILALLLVSTLLFAFATGFRVGQAQTPMDAERSLPNDSLDSVSELDRMDSGGLELAELRRTTGSAGEPADSDRVGASPFEKNPADRPARRNNLAANDMKSAGKAKQSSKSAAPKASLAQKSLKSKAATPKTREKKKQSQPKAAVKKSSPAQPKAVAAKAQPQTVAASRNTGDTNPRSALLSAKSGSLRLANTSADDRKASSSKPVVSKPNTDRQKPIAETKTKPRSYSLQLGAFSSRAAADRMAGSLKKQGFHPRIETSRGRHIVRVGRSDTARGLWKLEQGLRQKKYAPMRVSTSGK